MAFTCDKKYWRIDGFGEKNARIGGFAYPYSPTSVNSIFRRIQTSDAHLDSLANICSQACKFQARFLGIRYDMAAPGYQILRTAASCAATEP